MRSAAAGRVGSGPVPSQGELLIQRAASPTAGSIIRCQTVHAKGILRCHALRKHQPAAHSKHSPLSRARLGAAVWGLVAVAGLLVAVAAAGLVAAGLGCACSRARLGAPAAVWGLTVVVVRLVPALAAGLGAAGLGWACSRARPSASGGKKGR
jgi:hypothetical protein